MKKVFFKVLMMTFVVALSAGFVSCSSDDAEAEVTTTDVNVNLGDGTRALGACKDAWTWLQGHGYTHTGVVKQVAYDFASANDIDKIPAITVDEACEIPCTIPGTEAFFYRVEDVKDLINHCLNNGQQGFNGSSQQFAKWETGSLQGYEFKNATGDVLYAWAGVHVIATNGYINTQHSGGEMY